MARKRAKKKGFNVLLVVIPSIILILIIGFLAYPRPIGKAYLQNAKFEEFVQDKELRQIVFFDVFNKDFAKKECVIEFKIKNNDEENITYYNAAVKAFQTVRQNITYSMPAGETLVTLDMNCSS